jgi:hypothetical protein
MRIITVLTLAATGLLAVRASGQVAPAPSNAQALVRKVADSLGMLRTTDEEDMIATVRYWATGTATVDGRACKLARYAASVNYHVPGARVDFVCAQANGQPGPRRIEVVAGNVAWNEDAPGGKATPVPGAAVDRLLNVWALPQGAVKAAILAGTNARMMTEAGATVLIFPAPSAGATMKLTLNARPIAIATGSQDLTKAALPAGTVIERVETRRGSVVTETTYTEYGDWNGSDYFSDVPFPKHIVQTQGGVTVLDLTIDKTNTYNPYVVIPVPQNVRAAGDAAVNR